MFTLPKREFALPDRALQPLPGHRRGLGPVGEGVGRSPGEEHVVAIAEPALLCGRGQPALPGKNHVKLRHLAAIEPHAPADARSETRWPKLDFRCARAN